MNLSMNLPLTRPGGHPLSVGRGEGRVRGIRRVEVRSFLRRAGYHVAKSIQSPKDVVLPTAGIESRVEVHNSPGETERIAELLAHLEGVDLLTARDPEQPGRFMVLNSKGARGLIEWNWVKNSFKYSTRAGDPLDYLPVVELLSQNRQLDASGFATVDAWMS